MAKARIICSNCRNNNLTYEMVTCPFCGETIDFTINIETVQDEEIIETYTDNKKQQKKRVLVGAFAGLLAVLVALIFVIPRFTNNFTNKSSAGNIDGEFAAPIPSTQNDTQKTLPTNSPAVTEKTDSLKTAPPATPVPSTSLTPKPEHSYTLVVSDVTWAQAFNDAGVVSETSYLATVNSVEEFETLTAMADAANLKMIWVGAKREINGLWDDTKWITGESLAYTKWYTGEPSYKDGEIDEYYLMLFCVSDIWYFNDAPNDVTQYYPGKIGYIIEKE